MVETGALSERRRRLPPALGLAWRIAVICGLAIGLAIAPWMTTAAGVAVPVGVGCLALLVAARPRSDPPRLARLVWLACLVLSAATAGLGIGELRLAAIDAGALAAEPGSRLAIAGHVAAVPRRSEGEVRVVLATREGRALVKAPEPVPDLTVGARVRLAGVVREPAEWERPYLARIGIARIVEARSIELIPGARPGLAGALDRIRASAEVALGRGTSTDAAALLRGFVLGQDNRISASIVEDFKRSGLAHLLAVSGQNVVLLALLAAAALAILEVPLRSRLAWTLLLIAVYVPVAGAGPSIQRAGVMGAAGIVAAFAGRPRSRWYALLLAAAATLALNPRASGDVGWQLSFAAVIGIALGASRLRALVAAGGAGPRAALADGFAVTVAATLATAPLVVFHFGTASIAALPANLVALPAVAPVMWLGMVAAAAGQAAWIPVEPITWLAGVCAGYIAQVAEWFATPGWALLEVELSGALALGAVYAALTAGTVLAVRAAWRRRSLGPLAGRRRRRLGLLACALGLVPVAAGATAPEGPLEPPPAGLRVRILDVGQGDSILLEPARGRPLLVDAGTAEAGVAEELERLGIERLAAAIATHPESDHAGGLPAVLTRIPTERLLYARATRMLHGMANAVGARPVAIGAGDRFRSGALSVEVLWPPRPRVAAARAAGGPLAGDPNELSLVLLARWRGFEILLTGDAEAELAPLDLPAIDVLKVAHHGSEDVGLAGLLEQTRPRLAVISVGTDNPFGHPAQATLDALGAVGTPVRRTDEEGEIVIDVSRGAWEVR